jgi:hypothetical protein
LTVLDDTLRLAGPRIEIDPAEAHIRATGMAVAQDWLLRLPAGEARDEVIALLAVTVERAVQALTGQWPELETSLQEHSPAA